MKIIITTLSLLFLFGCASIARQSDDGQTLTVRSWPGRDVSAHFPNGASISSSDFTGPKQIGVAYQEGSTAGIGINELRGLVGR